MALPEDRSRWGERERASHMLNTRQDGQAFFENRKEEGREYKGSYCPVFREPDLFSLLFPPSFKLKLSSTEAYIEKNT